MKKSLQKTTRRRPLSNFDSSDSSMEMDRIIARKVLAKELPEADRRRGCVERLKMALATGDTSETRKIIAMAHTDRLADEAVREHIAELLDRNIELSVQLRSYCVMYLIQPIAIMRRWEEND